MDNKIRLQEYLDDTLINIDVRRSVVIDGVVYWSMYHNCDICEIMQKLGCVNYIKLSGNHILIKHDDLVEKYGDPFNFDDFDVHSASLVEINHRLESFDFDYDGMFIDLIINPKLCFIRVNSIDDDVKDKLCNILNISNAYIGRLSDKQYGWDLIGSGWFYFKV